MFETNYRNSIPGYTGHVSGKVENDVPIVNREARKHIPGNLLNSDCLRLWRIFDRSEGRKCLRTDLRENQLPIDCQPNRAWH